MLGGLWLAQRGAVAGLTATTVSAIALLGAMLIGFAATDIFWLALPCAAVAGFALIVVGVGEQTLLQNAVDPGLRGRVMALYGMINRGAPGPGRADHGNAVELGRPAMAGHRRRRDLPRRLALVRVPGR